MLTLWYGEAATLASSPPQQKQASSSPGAQTPIDNSPSRNTSSSPSVTTTSAGTSGQQPRLGNSHDLALLFIIFCFGSLTDVDLPSPPDNIPAERYYQITKVSLMLDPQAGASELFFIYW
jgi:hypothetical protein